MGAQARPPNNGTSCDCACPVPTQQVVARLTTSLPVFIDADGWEEPAEELDDIFLGDAELWCGPCACWAIRQSTLAACSGQVLCFCAG